MRRIGEPVQTDVDVMSMLQRVGATPGSVVTLRKAPAGVLVGSSGETAELDAAVASHVFVATIVRNEGVNAACNTSIIRKPVLQVAV